MQKIIICEEYDGNKEDVGYDNAYQNQNREEER